MQTKLTTALAILLLAGASGAAMAQDHEHGERGQAAPQAHPESQHAGPPPGGGGHGGGQPHAEGPRGPGPGGGERAGHAGPPPGAIRGPEGRGPESRGPESRGGERGAQAPTGGQPRFSHEAGPGPGPGSGAPRQFDRERGPREVIPPGAERGREVGPGGRPDGRFDGRNGGDRRFDGRPGDRAEGHAPLFNGGRGAHWQAGHYPPVMWAHDRFRAGSYRTPYGYYSRAWGFGDFLPRPWFARDYWLDDFLDFDLPYPPPGFTWVRVGPDALMIDRFTGRVVQVVRGIFW